MTTKLITAPLVEPVTLDDIEGQCQTSIPSDQVDTVIGYIAAIRQKCENELRRALITQTHDLILDAFPAPSRRNPFAAIEIPLPPLQSVVSVKYMSADHVLTTLDPSLYVIDPDSTPGRVLPAYGQIWPATLDYPGSVRVQFVAGYGGPVAWDPLTVYPVDARMFYTNGNTYRKTAVTLAGVLPTVTASWALDSPGYAVPQCIRNWMKLNISNLYENRESESVSDSRMSQIDLSTMADSLLDPERWEVRV